MRAKSPNQPKRADLGRVREFLRHPLPCVMMAASLFKETNQRVFTKFAKSGVKVVVVPDENFNFVLTGIQPGLPSNGVSAASLKD